MAFRFRQLLPFSSNNITMFRRFAHLPQLRLTTMKTEIVASDFVGMSHLRYLDLSDCQLDYIDPTAFKPLKNLEVLVFGPKNNLTPSIFEVINGIPSLETLVLNAAQLEQLPSLGNLKNLTQLHMTMNNLKFLGRNTFEGMSNLKGIDLRANQIETIEPETFVHLKNLKELYLGGNVLGDSQSAIFKGLESLEKLDLGWNSFEEIGNAAFSEMPSLKVLDLRHHEGLTEVNPENFKGLKNLRMLNLAETNLSCFNGDILRTLPKLESLNLSSTKIREFPRDALKFTPNLIEVNLAGTKVVRV